MDRAAVTYTLPQIRLHRFTFALFAESRGLSPASAERCREVSKHYEKLEAKMRDDGGGQDRILILDLPAANTSAVIREIENPPAWEGYQRVYTRWILEEVDAAGKVIPGREKTGFNFWEFHNAILECDLPPGLEDFAAYAMPGDEIAVFIAAQNKAYRIRLERE